MLLVTRSLLDLWTPEQSTRLIIFSRRTLCGPIASDRKHQETRHREKSSQHDQTGLEATSLILELANHRGSEIPTQIPQ